jgi:hypothetical protein
VVPTVAQIAESEQQSVPQRAPAGWHSLPMQQPSHVAAEQPPPLPPPPSLLAHAPTATTRAIATNHFTAFILSSSR